MRWISFRPIAVVLTLCLIAHGAAIDFSSIQLADAAMEKHDYNGARSLYERALASGAQFETDVNHARNLATAYLNSAPPDLTNGIKWLRVGLKIDPHSESLRLELAKSLLRIGDPDGAIEHYRVLADAHPQSAEYVVALATALRQAGKSEDALHLLQATTERFPNLVSVRVEYARLLNFTKQFPEAKRQFSIVLASDPENVIAQVGMAKTISYEGDQTTALQMYERILKRYPGLYDAIIGKAFSLLWSGHEQPARFLLEEGLAQHPEDREVREALAALRGSAVEKQPPAAPKRSTYIRHSADLKSIRQGALLPEVRKPDLLAAPQSSEAPGATKQTQKPGPSGIFWLITTCFAIALIAGAISRLARQRYGRLNGTQGKFGPATQCARPSEVQAPSNGAVEIPGGANRKSEEDQHLQATKELGGTRVDATRTPGTAQTKTEAANCLRAEMQGHASDSKIRQQVLLVGGSANIVRLESRWLAAREVEVICECEWVKASVRLLNTPPDLVVLNTTTDDRWTGSRILKWIAENQPSLLNQTVSIIGSGGKADNLEVRYLFEPFGATEWNEAVHSLLDSGHCKTSLHFHNSADQVGAQVSA